MLAHERRRRWHKPENTSKLLSAHMKWREKRREAAKLFRLQLKTRRQAAKIRNAFWRTCALQYPAADRPSTARSLSIRRNGCITLRKSIMRRKRAAFRRVAAREKRESLPLCSGRGTAISAMEKKRRQRREETHDFEERLHAGALRKPSRKPRPPGESAGVFKPLEMRAVVHQPASEEENLSIGGNDGRRKKRGMDWRAAKAKGTANLAHAARFC